MTIAPCWEIPFTIDAAFELIQQGADPDSVEVLYDPDLIGVRQADNPVPADDKLRG